jgi:hypothetical protein
MNKIAYLSIVLIVLLQGCSIIKRSNDKIEGISYSTTFPDLFNPEAKITGYIPIQRNVYFHNDQIMYHGSNPSDSIVHGKVLKTRPAFYYFVYTKGKQYGLYYNLLFKEYAVKVKVDSMLKRENAYFPYRADFYDSTLIRSNRKFISQKYNTDSTILHQIYTLKGGRPGEQAPEVFDSLYLTFSKKFKPTEYTLSRQFDSIMKMKLIQVTFILNSIYFKEQDYTFDKCIAPHILEEINIDNTDELIKYFDEDKKKNAKEEKRK